MYTTEDIKALASTGACLIIDANFFTAEAAKDIVRRAAAAGGHVTVKNCRKKFTIDAVKSMAQVGGKYLTLDVTES